MKWTTIALLLVFASASAETGIYKWVMPDGTVQYSDRPQEQGAKQLELSPLVTYTPPPISARAEEGAPAAPASPDGYDSFGISSPADDTTIRDNGGNVTLRFSVSPTLVQGHAIDVFLDGKKFGRSNAPLVGLNGVSRGPHEVYGVLVDENGAELRRSESVSFHLKRASLAGTAKGGASGPGGPASPGGPANPGGPASPGGPRSPGGPKSGGGATP